MSESVRSGEDSELTEKQEMLIIALLSLPTIEAAAKVAGISDRTARRWFQLPHFQEAYKSAKRIAFDTALGELRDNVDLAISTLKRNMTSDTVDPAVQVRAAKIWIDSALAIYQNSNLEQKQTEILEKLKEIGVRL